MIAATLVTSHDPWLAAMRRHASSSGPPIYSVPERPLRPSLACISRPVATICNEGDR